jgi:protein-tyrosine phosphatase
MPVPGPGRLSTMPHPRGGQHLDGELRALRRAGVDVLVCLQTAVERRHLGLRDEPAAAVRAGLEFHQLPIVDFGVPGHAEAGPLLDLLAGRLTAGRHVAVHCLGGVGRSSLVAAVLLVRSGIPVERVWGLVAAARGCPVPETEQQRQWLDHPLAGGRG